MATEILTKDDLIDFKTELFEELKTILKGKGVNLQQKEWLKSYEVRKMLGISPGTLQNLRINGSLSYTRIGGLMYYKYDDIQKMMDENKKKSGLRK